MRERAPRTRSGVLSLLLCGVALTLAACGDDDDGTAAVATAPGAAQTSTAAAGDGALDQASIDVAARYVGARAGTADPSLTPVTVGFVVQEGGALSFPEQTAAAQAAVSLVNEHLGGIHGHPLKLETCNIQSEEDGQKCGAQMLAAKVPIVDWSLAVVGNASYHKTLGGRVPTIVGVSTTPADNSSANAYALDGGAAAVIAATATEAGQRGAKKVSIIASNNAAGKFATEQVLKPSLKALGISATTVFFADSATTPDIVSALPASGAGDADLIVFLPPSPAMCVAIHDGMKQLGIGTPVIATGGYCNAKPFIDHIGGRPEGWSIANYHFNPRIEDDPEARLFRQAMQAVGSEESTTLGFAVKSFGDLLTIARFATTIGPDGLTPAAFEKEIAAFRGPMFMVPGELRCGRNAVPSLRSNCGDSASISMFENGTWRELGPFKNAGARFT